MVKSTPSSSGKAKKPAKETRPKTEKRAPKAAKAADEEEGGGGGGEDEEEEDEELVQAAKKPLQNKPLKQTDGEPSVVVPARRLTPEAKAKVNEMVKKGMSLTEALKAAASWETFVAPVKDEAAKLVPGKFEGGGPGRPRMRSEEEDPPELDEEPAVEAED